MNITETDLQQLNEWEGFLSIKPTWLFEQFINRHETTIALFCLHGDDFLYTPEGCVPAKKIKVGSENLGGNTENNEPFEDNVYEVIFANGNKVRCNLEHPFWWIPYKSSTKPKWKSLKDILGKQETVHGSKWGYGYFADASEFKLAQDNRQAAKLLGYLCSDGYITGTKQSVKFTNNNVAFLSEVTLLTKRDFPAITPKLYAKGKGFDLLLTEKSANCSGNSLKNYIKSLQITIDSYGDILRAKKQNLVEFVQGFFNGDGYLLIRKRKNGFSETPHVEIGFCIGSSRQRAYEFQYILWKLGISSYVCEEMFKSAKKLFYRVKVNQTSIKECFDILENTKYPEKFAIAKELLFAKVAPKEICRKWVSIKSINPIGRASMAGISTSTKHLYGVCGMKTHNTGNQWGKNVNIVKQYIMRWLGIHPIEAKNMRPDKKIRTYRFCSETLPNDPEAVDKNTIYPVLKRLLPKSLIKKDITARNSVVTIKDIQGGDDIFVEFVSYKQDIQAGAGVQRASVYLDENCNRAFYEEQLPRLLASDGDLIVGMTPALGQITWQYEDIYEKAKTVIRTQIVCDRYEKRFGEKIPLIKNTDLTNSTCVLMAATDDNPFYDTLVSEKNQQELKLIELGEHPFYKDTKTFKPITKSEYISNKLELIDDETTDVRRFGIFRQISGRIFKDFDASVHVINGDKYFPEGIQHNWYHARGIDYHPHVDWHCGFTVMSPSNEMFIYNEAKISPEKFVTHEIASELRNLSGDYKYSLNLIDPLSAEKQPNTGTSPVEDLNRIFGEYQKSGKSTGGYWSSWDTKSLRGRDEIKKRLKNSKIVGKPFANNGLPTLWILDNCKHTIESFKNWKLEEWGNRASLETHEIKEKPQQKFSHMNMVWEAICKHPAWRPRKEYQEVGGFKERHTYNDKMRAR